MQIDGGNVRAMAIGCSILGAGGGGDTAIGVLAALQAVQDHGPVDVVDLDDLDDDDLVMPCGGIGAPLVWIEKIDRGDEIDRIIPVVERPRRPCGPDVGGDRRLERPRTGHVVRACRASHGRRRRHGPCVPRGPPGHDGGRRDLREPCGDDRRARQRRDLRGDRRSLDGADGAGDRGRVRWPGVLLRIPDDRGAGEDGDRARDRQPRDPDRGGGARGASRSDGLPGRDDRRRATDRGEDRGRRAPHHGRLRPRIRHDRGVRRRRGPGPSARDPEREPRRPRGRCGARHGAGHHHGLRHPDGPGGPHRAPALRSARHGDRVPLRPDLADGAWPRARRASGVRL